MSSPRFHVHLLFLIVLLGLGLRVLRLTHSEAYVARGELDQVLHIKHAHELLAGESRWTYLGPELPSSQLPSFCYIPTLALSIKYFGSPALVWLVLLLLNLLAFLCCYGAVRILDPSRPEMALMTTLLLAVLPYPVNFAANQLNPAFILPFSCIAFWGLCRWILGRDAKGFVVASASLALLLQFHLIAVFALAVLPLLGWIYRPPVGRKELAVGLLFLVGPAVGYLLCDATTGLENTRAAVSGLRSGAIRVEALRVFTDTLIVGVIDFSYFLPTGGFKVETGEGQVLAQLATEFDRGTLVYREFLKSVLGYATVGFVVVGVHITFLLGCLIYALRRLRSHVGETDVLSFLRSRPDWGVVLLWTLVPSALVFVTGQTHHPRYSLILFPAILLLQVKGWLALVNAAQGRLRMLAYLLPIIAFIAVWMNIGHSLYLRERLYNSEVLHPSLANLEGIHEVISSQSGGRSGKTRIDTLGINDRFYLESAATLERYISFFEGAQAEPRRICAVPPGPSGLSGTDFQQIGSFRSMTVYCKNEP